MSIQILKTGITSLKTDALVNAANEGLWEGGGVCGIIFKAAGANELTAACSAIGGCKTGSAVITPGFNLKSKYIIHAVGPRWQDGKHDEPKLLYSAYKQSLILAVENGCKSIGFPLISTGIFGYPADKAWRKALQACIDFLRSNPNTDIDIQFAVIDEKILDIGKKTFAELTKKKTIKYLNQLNTNSLQTIKIRISRENGKIIDRKVNPMVDGLIKVLCDPKVIQILSADQLITMMEAIFPESVLMEEWITKYCDILLRVIDETKKKKSDGRAERYERYLREVLIPVVKVGTGSYDGCDLETLEDAFIVAACLYHYYTEKDKEFVFGFDLDKVHRFIDAIPQIKGIGNQLGLAFVPVKNEERRYAIFLSWILEEFLDEQESLKEGYALW